MMAKEKEPSDKADKELLEEAREQYTEAEDQWSELQSTYEEDYRFGRLSQQWPDMLRNNRQAEGRPVLTINRMPSFLRQVINDGRQNRPSVKVRPVGDGADEETAKVFAGIVRHVESRSDADVAYDTALDTTVSGGFGFCGVDVEYANDSSFDKELRIVAKPNPLSILWDARSTASDSSDWRYAFETEEIDKEEFEEKYPDADSEIGSFASDAHLSKWYTENSVRVTKWYYRNELQKKILLLSDGMIVDADEADDEFMALIGAIGVSVVREREVTRKVVNICKITGKNILERTEWPGSVIPIVPMWGDTLNLNGDIYYRSLIHDAMDAQRIHNYSRSTATELVSLAPKVPFIGEEGAFDADTDKWTSINQKSWPYVQYSKNKQPPQRQPFEGVPTGAMNEAAASLEDMKSIIGIHDASLGIAGNEISGKAIRYRQKESDTSTFHFIDNQHRMIRGIGRILIEMIPHVYTPGRIVRIIGDDGRPQEVELGGPPKPMQMPMGVRS
jgi:hypothetical protein